MLHKKTTKKLRQTKRDETVLPDVLLLHEEGLRSKVLSCLRCGTKKLTENISIL